MFDERDAAALRGLMAWKSAQYRRTGRRPVRARVDHHPGARTAPHPRAGQLARALDSLLAQDHPDHEIVVVDNAPRGDDSVKTAEGPIP